VSHQEVGCVDQSTVLHEVTVHFSSSLSSLQNDVRQNSPNTEELVSSKTMDPWFWLHLLHTRLQHLRTCKGTSWTTQPFSELQYLLLCLFTCPF